MDRLARRRGRRRRGARGRADAEADLEAIRAATFTVEAVKEREGSPTTTSPPSSTCSAASRRAGRALDPLRADLLRRARHRARAAAPARRASSIVAGARELAAALAERAREHARHAVRRAHPRRPRRADHVRPQARRLRVRGPPQRRAARARVRPGRGRRDLRRGRHLRRRSARTTRRACSTRLGLRAEHVSTQVVPRDRHAELLQAIALAGAGLERFATEIRHLQRTEVREVEEPFRAGQKGSSAMPHKRNPITTERITGLARVLRGYAQAAIENVALWHERDISHSGAERVILPDATILLDYMQHLALRVVRGMVVHADRMRAQPRAHLRRAVLPARAARAGRAAAWRATTPTGSSRSRPAGVGHADAAARAARRRAAAVGPRPRRDLRLRALHAPRARGARAARRDRRCRHERADRSCCAAPGASADLFHAIPLDIIDPFLYVELDDRRVAVIGVLDADRIEARGLGIEVLDPFDARAATSCSTRASASSRPRSSATCARARSSASSTRSCRPTSRSRGPTGCARSGIELRVDAERSTCAGGSRPTAQLAGIRRAQKAPPTPRWRAAAALCASCRPGLTVRAGARGDAARLRRARRRAARRRDRRPRRAGGRRPRGGLAGRSTAARSS